MQHLIGKTVIVEPAEPKMQGVVVNHLENLIRWCKYKTRHLLHFVRDNIM
jgi:methyl coenzyme M reductase subunit C